MRQQQTELLAAVACREAIGIIGDHRQGGADLADAGVAFRMAIGVVERFEVIDVDHQQHQSGFGLLGLHPFEIEPALEAAAVGEPGQHVDRGHHRQAVVDRHQAAFALGEPRRHGIEGARQRHEFGRQPLAFHPGRPIAVPEFAGDVGEHVDRPHDQPFGGEQRADQRDQTHQRQLQIGVADRTIDLR